MHLTAENLAARRGEDLIFVNISFHLAAGEALVLTGRNGSGKSTLLRVAAGLLRPEKGTVIFHDEGSPGGSHPGEVSHYLGHRNAMKNELTVAENLDFWRVFLGDTGGAASLAVEDAAEAVGLSGITHLPFGYLSAGQQRRFAFAKLLVAHRPVWILDEPTAALDASAYRLFTDLITAHLEKGGIVLAATHQPLRLRNSQELKMTGFAGVDHGVWG
ncbi:heme ABC exporter ATP-binding protein CcmA [Rhizobium ruizarguesonis]|jgi:heme exporter protein A|uniref:Heme ABC exporter ATP-binding protein CcmA n=1 Tax=Rhizobium ruizarguesonis TaxID=2081791 RepID=A0AAE8QGH2_9HYPH|nr:heme ABC exporter ATP-binding protein CcmA [Rhizobium ruizarguesonis]MBY5804343.1 heme ABC exporter ATP-binding protein CcmA [Rhizobium leguminosarum]NKL12958.1 heme ABC exporter ATP-binding protein CcmA [Rhizobium leguminosarum bv. viciae]MBY5844850.1 heme ABC exporter ATP-binding protein CcmA [Rhizobium leguminosarum]MBY5850001.1 heme ABC exporter ATP-binding protein CcmA [Rhizobium leguminosarum]MBY5881589.1 heme ABC exporter ATP-binding protein CcmA [Rhizobium leguminosarum]